MKYFIVTILLLFNIFAHSQESIFSVKADSDTVLFGNPIEVTFSLVNASGRNFELPKLKDFDVVGGPSQSSSMSMINGETTQSMSFTYLLQARAVGRFYIEPAAIQVGSKTLETKPIAVVVLPNPDGIRRQEKRTEQADEFKNFWNRRPSAPPEQKPKKERKIYKI